MFEEISPFFVLFSVSSIQKTLLILTETSTGTDRVHQAAANTEERPHIFTDNNAYGAPIKPVLVPYY
jgi:hypothetical protein